MSAQRDIISLIKRISGQANVLTIPRLYIDIIKAENKNRIQSSSHRAALVLSQCVYWSDRTKDPDGWFWKTYAQWDDELGIPKKGMMVAVARIERWVETKTQRVGKSPKQHYRVRMDVLAESIAALIASGLDSSILELSESSKMELSESVILELSQAGPSYSTETTNTETTARNGARPSSRDPNSPEVQARERVRGILERSGEDQGVVVRCLEGLTGKRYNERGTVNGGMKQSDIVQFLRERNAGPRDFQHFAHYWQVTRAWQNKNGGTISKPTILQVYEEWDTAREWQPQTRDTLEKAGLA